MSISQITKGIDNKTEYQVMLTLGKEAQSIATPSHTGATA
jgi:hypothetical protein